MNDFTKEELLILHLELETTIATAKILKVPKHVIALKDKIQYMIDNFERINYECPHENAYQDSVLLTYCEDCEEIIHE